MCACAASSKHASNGDEPHQQAPKISHKLSCWPRLEEPGEIQLKDLGVKLSTLLVLLLLLKHLGAAPTGQVAPGAQQRIQSKGVRESPGGMIQE